jgi:hypothetical protein
MHRLFSGLSNYCGLEIEQLLDFRTGGVLGPVFKCHLKMGPDIESTS